jgi:hypothetical protein
VHRAREILAVRFFDGSVDVLDTLNGQELPDEWHGYTFYYLSNRVLAVVAGLCFFAASSALRRLAGGQRP